MTLLGVGYDETGDIAVMVLREVGGARVLPIWISGHEGRVIERTADGDRSSRPLTHEVLVDVVHVLGRTVTGGVVTGIADGIFRAELRFGSGTGVDARPSDMVRVALTVGAPMHVDARVLDEAGMSLDEVDASDGADGAHPDAAQADVDADVDAFRTWLDTAQVEDFRGP